MDDPTKDGIGLVDYFGDVLGKGVTVRVIMEPHGGCSVNFTKIQDVHYRGGAMGKKVKSATGYNEGNPMLAAMQARQRWEKE